MKRIVSLVLSICFLFMYQLSAFADNIEYSTKGCVWSKINDVTYVTDIDGDGAYDVTLTQDGNDWRYSFVVPDVDATYYAWEEDVPEGYVVAGRGTRADPVVVNESIVKYSYTSNVDENGKKLSDMKSYQDIVDVVSIPGVSQLRVDLTYGGYQTSSYPYWVCLWDGEHRDYKPSADFESSVTGKISPPNNSFGTYKASYMIDGDTVTIGMRSTGYSTGYGYYAVVTGIGGVLDETPVIVNEKDGPVVEKGSFDLEKRVVGDDGVVRNFGFDIELSSDDDSLSKFLAGSQAFGDVVFHDGKALVYLRDCESVRVSDVPVGVHWSITEQATDGYDVTWSGDGFVSDANRGEGVVSTDVTSVTCTNVRKDDPLDNVPVTDVVVLKKADGTVALDDSFDFHAIFTGLAPGSSYGYSLGTDDMLFGSDSLGMADVEFSLGIDQSVTFVDIPVGASYMVMECANDYMPSFEITGCSDLLMGSRASLITGEDMVTSQEVILDGDHPVVTFTNRGELEAVSESVDLRVRKVWQDNDNKDGLRPDFVTVYLMDDGDVVGSARLDDDNGWCVVFTDLCKYRDDGVTACEYMLSEVQVPGYVSYVATMDDGFEITNTAIDVGDLFVSKEIKDADRVGDSETLKYGLDVDFTFRIECFLDGVPVDGVFELDSERGTKTGSVVFDNGVVVVSLKHGESMLIENLPAGSVCTVTETVRNDFVPVESSIAVDIRANKVSNVKFMNGVVE